jgi:general secretion pathway protein H
MPISAPGTSRNPGQAPISGISAIATEDRSLSPISEVRGFTLIELLVVLLIMGLTAGLVGALAHPDERTRLRVEAERLAQLLDLAAVESRLTGKPIAWTAALTPEGAHYRFWRWREDFGWFEAGNGASGDSLRPRSLPPGMAISELRIEAARPALGLRLEFDPNGSLAYDFQMSLGAARYAVTASPLGEVRIHESR